MKVMLAYGRTGLEVELPDDRTDVVEPVEAPELPAEETSIVAALRAPLGTPPLRALAGPADRVVVVVNDGTRPMRSDLVLPPLLAELAAAGVPRERVTILVATGTHRPNTAAELDEMLGLRIARGYRVVNHDARDHRTLARAGTTVRGVPILLNKLYLEASVTILTGFVEPHFFAGYSGGPKLVMPGLAGLETVLHNHGPRLIAHPRASFGVLEGNPIHEEQRAIALATHPTFSVNVTLAWIIHENIHRIGLAADRSSVDSYSLLLVPKSALRPLQTPYIARHATEYCRSDSIETLMNNPG